MTFLNLGLRDGDGGGEGALLLLGRVDPGRDVPARDEESVAGADREAVP
jgi:hypothetical protein